MENITKMVKVFKALSNENRLQLFMEIQQKENLSINEQPICIISEIASCMKIGAPTISHHIKELENAGLILTSKEGKQITARINKSYLSEISTILS